MHVTSGFTVPWVQTAGRMEVPSSGLLPWAYRAGHSHLPWSLLSQVTRLHVLQDVNLGWGKGPL